jgi:5-methyltetrahydrofolate--homocysteine methyltransferase
MASYAHLAADSGARIIGGCCGTGFAHLHAMHDALAHHSAEARPDEATVVARLGPLQAPGAKGAPHAGGGGEGRRNRRQ